MKNIVAQTILEQLGGNKFLAMTGSKNLVGHEKTLTMKLTKNKISAKWLRITLNNNDLYKMEFIGGDCSIKVVLDNVYGNMLQESFTNVTGLFTKL